VLVGVLRRSTSNTSATDGTRSALGSKSCERTICHGVPGATLKLGAAIAAEEVLLNDELARLDDELARLDDELALLVVDESDDDVFEDEDITIEGEDDNVVVGRIVV
jgi:hypothetical protein